MTERSQDCGTWKQNFQVGELVAKRVIGRAEGLLEHFLFVVVLDVCATNDELNLAAGKPLKLPYLSQRECGDGRASRAGAGESSCEEEGDVPASTTRATASEVPASEGSVMSK